jgi:hypothetical protein
LGLCDWDLPFTAPFLELSPYGLFVAIFISVLNVNGKVKSREELYD